MSAREYRGRHRSDVMEPGQEQAVPARSGVIPPRAQMPPGTVPPGATPPQSADYPPGEPSTRFVPERQDYVPGEQVPPVPAEPADFESAPAEPVPPGPVVYQPADVGFASRGQEMAPGYPPWQEDTYATPDLPAPGQYSAPIGSGYAPEVPPSSAYPPVVPPSRHWYSRLFAPTQPYQPVPPVPAAPPIIEQPIYVPQPMGAPGYPPVQQVRIGGAEQPAPAPALPPPLPALRRPSPIVATLLMVSGLLVFLSSFFVWIEGVTGWGLMFGLHFGPRSNMLFSATRRLLVFSGFWAMLFGVLIMAGALMLLLDMGPGGVLAVTTGVLGLILAVISIATAYASNLTPGPGVFLFAVFSLMSVILGITAIAERRYWADRSYLYYNYRSPYPPAVP